MNQSFHVCAFCQEVFVGDPNSGILQACEHDLESNTNGLTLPRSLAPRCIDIHDNCQNHTNHEKHNENHESPCPQCSSPPMLCKKCVSVVFTFHGHFETHTDC